MSVTNHLLHPFAEAATPETDFVNIVRAEGSIALRRYEASEYLDGMASLWYCQVGHGRREIIDAITAQMHELATYNIFAPFTNDPAREAGPADRREVSAPERPGVPRMLGLRSGRHRTQDWPG